MRGGVDVLETFLEYPIVGLLPDELVMKLIEPGVNELSEKVGHDFPTPS